MVRQIISEDTLEEYKIALSYDPEDNPSPLFDYTFHLAKLLKGKVVIVHALENLVSTKTDEEEEKILRNVEQILGELNPPVEWKVEIIYGKEVENFIQFVEKKGINLLAFYYFKKLFGKSLSEQFVEQLTNCGLLVVKEKQTFKPIKKVLVPVDFSESSFKQKDFVLRLKEGNDLKVDFLHVLEDEDKSEEEEVKLLFGELFEGIGNLRLEFGKPAEEIIEILKNEGYDLVIIGRTGRGLNLDYGNVAQEVIKEVPCPVVVV
ncbi:MAG: hypothetical protein DSZ31_05380 [Gammaproteobacteria bacterium]|nr:MAG: hypothetical protein DSZ31_05380 [Gammaproteobacteria bacterium]